MIQALSHLWPLPRTSSRGPLPLLGGQLLYPLPREAFLDFSSTSLLPSGHSSQSQDPALSVSSQPSASGSWFIFWYCVLAHCISTSQKHHTLLHPGLCMGCSPCLECSCIPSYTCCWSQLSSKLSQTFSLGFPLFGGEFVPPTGLEAHEGRAGPLHRLFPLPGLFALLPPPG